MAARLAGVEAVGVEVEARAIAGLGVRRVVLDEKSIRVVDEGLESGRRAGQASGAAHAEVAAVGRGRRPSGEIAGLEAVLEDQVAVALSEDAEAVAVLIGATPGHDEVAVGIRRDGGKGLITGGVG